MDNPYKDSYDAIFGSDTPTNNTALQQSNPFKASYDEIFGDEPKESSSAIGAAARGFERGVAPALGGLATAAYGAAIGGSFAGPPGAIVGGLIGGFGGGYAIDKAQDYAIKQAPDSWQDALGFNEDQEKIDRQEHQYASFIGGLAPFAITMKPGKLDLLPDMTNFERLMASPVTSRLFSGAVVGGVELGQEIAGGNPPDWANVATATAFGFVFNKPNRLGQRIEAVGARLGGEVPSVREPVVPPEKPKVLDERDLTDTINGEGVITSKDLEQTLATHADETPTVMDGRDLGVMDIGATEETYLGREERQPEVVAAANAGKQTEEQILGQVQPDIDAKAREAHPELFNQYDELVAQRQTIQDQISELETPQTSLVLNQPSLIEQVVAELKKKYTLVDGKIQEILGPIKAAQDRTADALGVNPNQVTLDQNRQALFNYFKGQAIASGRPREEAIGWADAMANGLMTRATRMGFYEPHGISVLAPDAVNIPREGQTFNQPGFLPGFYSAVEHAVLTSKQEKASGQQWINQIRNTSGVKPEEVEWLGLEGWLKGLGRSASKQEVVDYLRANNLEMQERTPNNKETLDWTHISRDYSHLVLPGGDPGSYHETLITLPKIQPSFKSGHWDEPNTLAHIRFDTQTIDGKKTLRIHEIQSDWHQQGRKKGYINPDMVEKANADVDSALNARRDARIKMTQLELETLKHNREGTSTPDELIASLKEARDTYKKASTSFIEAQNNYLRLKSTTIPDAPFKTSWPELTLKRMIRYAADNGIEKISWPGDADAVARVEQWPKPELRDGRWYIHGDTDVTPIIERYTKELPKLAEKLGKKFDAKVSQDTIKTSTYKTSEDEIREMLSGVSSEKSPEVHLNSIKLSPEFRKAAQEKGFPLFQRSAANEPRARVTITPDHAEKVIEIFRRADASSLIHESGHIFLAQLAKDAQHPNAPQQIRDDLKTSLDWLGAKDFASLSTDQHEKWARGFEQYFLDGKAPSQGLARAFEMFKEWLTQIYGTFVRRGETVPPEIKSVMDRLLATDREIAQARGRPTIEPEARIRPTLFDIHSGEAHLPPHEADAAAASIAAERGNTVPPREIANEITQARATDTGGTLDGGATRLRGLDGNSSEAGNESGRDDVGNRGGQERQSGNRPTAQGSGASNPIAPTGAKTYSGSAGSKFLDRAGNIRLDNINTTEDIKQAMRDMAERNNDFIGNRKGPSTPGQQLDLAAAMGKNNISSSVGRAFTAEEIKYAEKILADASQASVDARKALIDSPTSEELAVKYTEAISRHRMAMETFSQATYEAGRALAALKRTQDFWTKAASAENKNLAAATGKTLYQLVEEAKLGMGMDDQFQNSKWVRDMSKPQFGRMIQEFFTNNILSGLATHITYTIAGHVLALNKILLEQPIAALIGQVRHNFDPARERVYLSEVGTSLNEMYIRSLPKATQAMIEGVRSGQQILMPGQGARPLPTWRKLAKGEIPTESQVRFTASELAKTISHDDVRWGEVKEDLFSLFRGMKDGIISSATHLKVDGGTGLTYSQLGYIPDAKILGATVPIGSIVRLPSRDIAALHSAQYTLNYSIENNAKAWRQATREVEQGKITQDQHSARVGELRQNPSTQSMADSSTRAYELSMLAESKKFVQALSKVFNWAPELPFLGETPILKFIDPFIHIAANVVDQAIVHRTPVGWLSKTLREDLLGHNGSIARDMAEGRMIVGTAIACTFAGLAMEGLMTGSGPSDSAKRAVWEAAGHKAHSLQIGNLSYSLNRLGSLGMLAGVAADLYGVGHQAEKGEYLLAAQSLHHALVQNLLDESFIRGPADAIMAIEDPQRYGERYIQNFLSSFLPASALLAQSNKAIDPYTRTARTVTDALMAKIPWVSQELMPRRDVWGEPIPNSDALIAKGLTAIYESKMSRDPVNIALSNLDVGIPSVPKSIRNVQLTEQEYDTFSALAGRLLKQRLTAFVTSPYWKQIDPQQQRRSVDEFVKQSRNVARGIMFAKYPHIPADAVRAKQDRFKDSEDD